jgi:replicative DNA helicase Mcm
MDDQNDKLLKKLNELYSIIKENISEALKEGRNSVVIPHKALATVDIELAEEVLDNPKKTLKVIEEFLKQKLGVELRVRIKDLPEDRKIRIRDIRSEHIGKLVETEGVIKVSTEVRPVVVAVKYYHTDCGREFWLNLLGNGEGKVKERFVKFKIEKPKVCEVCGRSEGKFIEVDKRIIDIQRLLVEETPDQIERGEQPAQMIVFLTEDLCEPKMERRTIPGTRVKIVGIVEASQTSKSQAVLDLMINTLYIEPVEKDIEDVKISEEDVIKIKEIAKSGDTLSTLASSIAPNVYGKQYDPIKKAIVLQLVGGVKKVRSDGTKVRGDIHILLIGDPGVAKSQILQFVNKIAPKSRFVSGVTASAVGITANVRRDEFLKGGWALEAGALVLASGGIVCLHPDTEVLINDRPVKISSLFKNHITLKLKNGKEVEVSPINQLTTSYSLTFKKLVKEKALLVARRWYEGILIKIAYDSKELLATPDHLILLDDEEWVPAKKVKEGDVLVGKTRARVIDVSEIPYEGYVYDLCVPGYRNFLANDVIVHNCIDELDKVDKEDMLALHEALEQQTITVNKANIHATLKSEVAVLAAANPKFGRWDKMKSVVDQIDLPPTIINRFDLIFVLRDEPDEDIDKMVAEGVVRGLTEAKESIIPPELFRKYIIYAKKINPEWTESAKEKVMQFYLTLRKASKDQQTIPITARQLESIIRLAEASARARLSKKVTEEDVEVAKSLLMKSLKEVGINPETQTLDIDILTVGISSTQRSRLSKIYDIIKNLQKDFPDGVPLEEIINAAKEQKIEEDKVRETIEKLLREGEIYECKQGHYKIAG